MTTVNNDRPVGTTGTFPIIRVLKQPVALKKRMSALPRPVLRKEVVSRVGKAEEPGTRSFGDFIVTVASRWVELAAFWQPVWTAWSHAFLSPGQNWGALFALHLPCKQQHWFLLPETLNKCNYFTGMLSCLSPGKKTPGSHASVMELSSLFSSGFIFHKILQRPETHTQPLVLDLWEMTQHHISLFLKKITHDSSASARWLIVNFS